MVKQKQKQKKIKKQRPVTNELKEEAARELGLEDEIAAKGWANLTSRETGKIGGYIAKKLRETQNSGVRIRESE